MASNISTAALFRSVEKFEPTLLVDEVDTFLKGNDELNGLLNAGHERDAAFVIRCEGESHEPKQFRVWCPKVLSGIGGRRDTIEDRSIIIQLRRKTKSEKTERLMAGKKEPFKTLRRKLARWSKDNIESLKTAEPEIPEELNDRAADNWRSLLSIADHAGGHWKLLSRRASLILSANDSEEESVGILLLEDIREFFYEEGSGRIESADLAKYLWTLEHRPWPEWRLGKPISPNGIARLLKHFKVRPKTIRLHSGRTAKGYLNEQFKDAFARYLQEKGV
jgi:putative DNA primase/helicase